MRKSLLEIVLLALRAVLNEVRKGKLMRYKLTGI